MRGGWSEAVARDGVGVSGGGVCRWRGPVGQRDCKGAITFPRTPNGVAEVFALWAPGGRFAAIPGVGLGDTSDKRFYEVQNDLGLPVGWNRSGALFLAKGRGPGDDDYVKPSLTRH